MTTPRIAMTGQSVSVVTTTVADDQQAQVLADAAIDAHLAACAKCRPVVSRYRWQGTVHHETEVVVEFVTAPSRVADLVALIDSVHPYEVPEVLVNASLASDAYAAWVVGETTGSDR